jgi:hypothetical protein
MKRLLLIPILVVGTLFAASLMSPAQVARQGVELADSTGLPEKIWKRGIAMAPVALNFANKDRRLVGEGSYIVNTSCVGCHTSPTYLPGGNPFFGQPERINTANYLAGGAQFGPFVSANITPDQSGRPAGLTFEQFVEVMRTGRDFKARHPQFGPLLQVMPWPELSKHTDDDLEAIYEYLSAIPHAEPAQQ